MSQVNQLLDELHMVGISISINKGNLRLEGETRKLSPEKIKLLKFHKEEIIQALSLHGKCIKCDQGDVDGDGSIWCMHNLPSESEFKHQWDLVQFITVCPKTIN